MRNRYTDDLMDFSLQGRKFAQDTLKAWNTYGLPDGFEGKHVKLIFDKSTNDVLLTNKNDQTCMLAYTVPGYTDKLLLYHTLPDNNAEGFLSDLMEQYSPSDLSLEDKVYIMTQREFDQLLDTGKYANWT